MGVSVELNPAAQDAQDNAPDAAIASTTRQLTVSPEPPVHDILSPCDAHYLSLVRSEDLTQEQREKWLARIASSYTDLWRQENHYRLIFGSQIAFLKRLHLFGPQPVDSVKEFYEANGAIPPPIPTYTFENWFGWLIESKDVAVEVDQVFITPLGKRFLQWMTEAAVVDQKAF